MIAAWLSFECESVLAVMIVLWMALLACLLAWQGIGRKHSPKDE